MSKELVDALRLKVGGKYVHSAKDVARHHGVHVNAVYQSRKLIDDSYKGKGTVGDKLDKIMLYDLACKIAFSKNDEDKGGLSIAGTRSAVVDLLPKMLKDGVRYVVVFKEDEDEDE